MLAVNLFWWVFLPSRVLFAYLPFSRVYIVHLLNLGFIVALNADNYHCALLSVLQMWPIHLIWTATDVAHSFDLDGDRCGPFIWFERRLVWPTHLIWTATDVAHLFDLNGDWCGPFIWFERRHLVYRTTFLTTFFLVWDSTPLSAAPRAPKAQRIEALSLTREKTPEVYLVKNVVR